MSRCCSRVPLSHTSSTKFDCRRINTPLHIIISWMTGSADTFSKQLQYLALLTCDAKSFLEGRESNHHPKGCEVNPPDKLLGVTLAIVSDVGLLLLGLWRPRTWRHTVFFGFGDSRNWKTEWLSGIPWYMVYCTYIIPISTSRKHFLWKLWFPLVNSSLVCEHRLDFWDFVFTPKSSHQTGRSLMSWRKTIDCRQTTTGNSQTIKQLKNQRPFVCFDLPNLKVKKILDDFAKPCMVHLLFHLVCRISFHASSFRSLGFDDFAWFTWGILGEDCSITPSAAPAQAKLSHPNLL